jgi:hypothetical protein
MNPHITHDTLIIPLDSDSKYHYWNDGQSISVILAELNAPAHVFAKYTRHQEEHIGEMCKCEKTAQATVEVFYCVPCGAWWEKP